MPRKPRLEYPGAFYHVFNRGNRRERIYRSAEDYDAFEKYLIEAAEWSGVSLFAWCLMPNHFHLLVETPDGNLSQFMRRLKTRYAKHFNKTYKLVGHVFQGRYRAILCDKEAYLLELVRYIHLNPIKVKAGSLCKDPGDWAWSSHRYYLQGPVPSVLKKGIGQVLLRFSSDPVAALGRYQGFVAEGLSGTPWETQYRIAALSYLGHESFIKEAWEKAGKKMPEVPPIAKLKSPEALARALSSILNLKEVDLQSSSQQRGISLARQVFVYIGKQDFKFSNVSLARYLGKDTSTISQILRRTMARERLKDKVEQARRALAV